MRAAILALVVGAFAVGVSVPLVAQWQSQRDTGGVRHVMEAVVLPGAEQVFDAVVWSNGELVASPVTEDDWEHIEHGALAIKEGAHLLMMPGRARDLGAWRRNVNALKEAAKAAELAAQRKSIDEVFAAGDRLYSACNTCHRSYAVKPVS